MIWTVTTPREKNVFMPDDIFACMKEVFGDGITLVQASPDDDFSYIKTDDIVLVQTRDRFITSRLVATGARTTAESSETVLLSHDKEIVKSRLRDACVPFPKTIVEPSDRGTYFVKPLHGEDSICVDEHSICHSLEEIRNKTMEIEMYGDSPIIEEFIDGRDCTVGIIMNQETGEPECYPVLLSYENSSGILTHELKFKDSDTLTRLSDERLKDYAMRTFRSIGAKHYMSVDFRMGSLGQFYMIDINLFPTLGSTTHLARCAKVCAGIEYPEFIKKVVETATVAK